MADQPLLRHICEVCGETEILTSEEGYRAGCDYPPKMGVFGHVSPRHCRTCPVEKTLWWRVTMENQGPDDLTDADWEVLDRIHGEPESLLVDPTAD